MVSCVSHYKPNYENKKKTTITTSLMFLIMKPWLKMEGNNKLKPEASRPTASFTGELVFQGL